jgi:hypothetical protein
MIGVGSGGLSIKPKKRFFLKTDSIDFSFHKKPKNWKKIGKILETCRNSTQSIEY